MRHLGLVNVVVVLVESVVENERDVRGRNPLIDERELEISVLRWGER